jgi:sigma-54 specific flagellar transcriptional regulator A
MELMAQSPATVTSPTSGPKGSGLVHGPQSPLIDTKRTCLRIAASEATVLLMGETGTGKEVFARFIHAGSPRAARPFVPVNCGAIPETLLESELFGYVKGAFTGAVAARRGRVALAEGGTLFLDEIGELPLSLQVKLLRLLQERTYEPIGSSDSVPANFRLVAATNRDLADEVRLGRFRSDLYYRLNVCPIRLPALRERRTDIQPLFMSFWTRRGETRPVEAAVMQCLEGYAWPGNVRELENLVERVSVCAEGDVIRVADLPMTLRAPHLGTLHGAGGIEAESDGAGTGGDLTGTLTLQLAGRHPAAPQAPNAGAYAQGSAERERALERTSEFLPPVPGPPASSVPMPPSATFSLPSLAEMASAMRAEGLAAASTMTSAMPAATADGAGALDGAPTEEHGNTPTPT